MKSWYRLRASRKTAELLLYEEIGAWAKTSKDFAAELDALGELKTITVRINSVGGDVFEALAMHNALARQTADVIVHIDGVCASAATLVALAGDEVRMADNALWMIHEPWTVAGGNAEVFQKQADLLDTAAEQITTIYARKTGADSETIRDWMRAETWYTAKQALEAGFVDAIDEPLRIAALATHDLSRFKNFSTIKDSVMSEIEVDTPVADVPDPEPTPAPAAPEVPGPEAARPLDAVSIARQCNAAREPGLTPILLATPHTQEQVEARIAAAAAVRRVCALAQTPDLADGMIAAGADENAAMLATWQTLADRSNANPVDPTPPNRGGAAMARAQFDALTPSARAEFIRAGGQLTD